MKGLSRTHYCGEVEVIGNEVTVGGFTQRVRDKGSLIFIDLRDQTGSVQLVFDETTLPEVLAKAKTVRSEYVLMAKGILRARESVNKDMKTGGVELLVNDLRILSKANTPPFEITNDTKVNEELRLKHRYLDLRGPKLQENLITRHK
ncbi:MAG: Asp-tRNA(Asn)/Glu-tRNA(Gln) amidotransferase GatCAB subunit C, partial [Ruminiclostridium sp.]|nr:Asp-tRNA(Asn)/Glu-tRNA(Gln) amidotransferase GatCAB subunit C [Ruminiclostridium sp.]